MTLSVQERELSVYRFYFTNTFFCLEFSTVFAITSFFFYLKILYTPFIKYVTGEHRWMMLIILIWFLLDLYEQMDGQPFNPKSKDTKLLIKKKAFDLSKWRWYKWVLTSSSET